MYLLFYAGGQRGGQGHRLNPSRQRIPRALRLHLATFDTPECNTPEMVDTPTSVSEHRSTRPQRRLEELWSISSETASASKILEKVMGTKNISSIQSVKKRILIPKVKNKEGEAVKTSQGIANVFAKFYEDLYEGEYDHSDEDMSSCTDQENTDSSQIETIPEFTTEEIQAAIDRLKKGKAKDSDGIRAEQLKICSDDTKEKIRTIFNEIALQEDFTPKSWRKIRIQVIYKKGDREDPGNYRPICGLPVLYKLFATVLYARLAPCLHKIQPPDKAGFRPNHRCEDHLTVYRILEQRCREWGVSLFISTIDFTIAFDSIKHSHYGNLSDSTESSQHT